MNFVLVFLGGGLGTIARHAVNMAAVRWAAHGWPIGTFVINILGSFLMGAIAGTFVKHMGLPQELRLFLATGVVGGFTTFSTYALEIVLLLGRGATLVAVAYALGSLVLGAVALVLGMWFAG